jgi:hypothetical protein
VRVREIGCVAAALAIGAATASAQSAASGLDDRWQVTLFGGGWNALTNPYLYRSPAFTSEVAFGNAPAFGLAIGRDVSAVLGLDLAWTQTSPAEQFVGSPPTPIRKVTLNIFELESLWYFRRGGFQPYGIFGIGGTNTGSSFGGTNLTLAVGLGVKAYLDRHFAVRADVRVESSYGNVGFPGEPAFCDSAGGCYFYRSSWSWSLPVTAGLTWAF